MRHQTSTVHTTVYPSWWVGVRTQYIFHRKINCMLFEFIISNQSSELNIYDITFWPVAPTTFQWPPKSAIYIFHSPIYSGYVKVMLGSVRLRYAICAVQRVSRSNRQRKSVDEANLLVYSECRIKFTENRL